MQRAADSSHPKLVGQEAPRSGSVQQHAGYKVLISSADNTIIGAHLARHNASEVINIFALAIKFGIKAGELAEFLWAYPTYTSDLKYMVR